jgi:hypothetical protein
LIILIILRKSTNFAKKTLKWTVLLISIYSYLYVSQGHAVALLVESLCYKLEGRGFESRCHLIFQLTEPLQTHYGPGVRLSL